MPSASRHSVSQARPRVSLSDPMRLEGDSGLRRSLLLFQRLMDQVDSQR